MKETDTEQGKRSTVQRLVMWFKRRQCNHEFKIKDLTLTGIKPLKTPVSNDYHEWVEYFSKYYGHDSVTKRVWWPCHKCGKGFYSHCGLSITLENGFMIVDT